MSIILSAPETVSGSFTRGVASPAAARITLLLVTAIAALVGLFITGADATAQAVTNAGADLARLLRFMAALKSVLALGAAAAVYWRFGAAIRPTWLAAYALACAAMGVGPGLIYGMAHVGLGALLLHGGIAASVVLLWRDPITLQRLAESVPNRMARSST